jgi:hypothetical protein
MSSLPDATPSRRAKFSPASLLTFLLRAGSFAARRAMQRVALPASSVREFGVGHEPVKSLRALEAVRRRHLQRGTDRHEPKVQLHPDFRIGVQAPKNALYSEQLSRQLVG